MNDSGVFTPGGNGFSISVTGGTDTISYLSILFDHDTVAVLMAAGGSTAIQLARGAKKG